MDMVSTPEQVLWYVQQLQNIYGHPDQRIKEILKDWAIHSWHLMYDCLDVDWRNDWPFRVCHYLATISKLTAGQITSAAAIMVAVFGAFATGQIIGLQQFGLGLGVAVLIDATVIR